MTERATRSTEEVVGELLCQMDTCVKAYGPGAVRVNGSIDGTAFFPGGIGLWRGASHSGRAPLLFPVHPIMFLGHNLDSVRGHRESIARGIERMTQGTWKYLQAFLEAANIRPEQCFFTNVFVSLQPDKANGKMKAEAAYYQQCRDFLLKQIEIVKPRLIAALGAEASEQLSGLVTGIPSIALAHPGSLIYKKEAARGEVVMMQGKQLTRALLETMRPENVDEQRNVEVPHAEYRDLRFA